MKEITKQDIDTFLHGYDPMERIITIECGYQDDQVSIIFKNQSGEKRIKREDYKPFVWAKLSAYERMFGGDRRALSKELKEYGIRAIGLKTTVNDGPVAERMMNGYKVLFQATRKMNYTTFLSFFKKSGVPIYPDKSKNAAPVQDSREFLAVSPIEQFMISTGKRLFKGYDDYDELLRLEWDLETTGLNTKYDRIDQIGLRTNKGFEKIITITGEGEERNRNELAAIDEALRIIASIKPDVITGHNSENFDWNFIFGALERLGSSIQEISEKYFREAIYKKKKPSVLKLGGEVEYFNQTVVWGHNITDSLHAVRRAQAIDSNMKKADLKYVTKYSKLNKPNRVYVPGDKIKIVWADTGLNYAFNDTNGNWYKIDEKHPLKEGFELKTGRYIVERYLLDDLYETDKVELRYNQSNFLLCKLLPTTFGRACTMGTAATWKMIMLAWSFENNLAIPAYSKSGRFTGGLSRLLQVGYVDRVVKLDYNSLYPSIILTWDIATDLDITGVMLQLLNYILTERERFKELKADAGKKAGKLKENKLEWKGTDEELTTLLAEIQKWESEESANDKKQLPFKIFGNSFFGGFGAPDLFNWGDLKCAEKTTCIGRQSLRLMISWFTNIGYTPIVGDSVTYDTPIIVKNKITNKINILPICDVFDDKSQIEFDNEQYRDFSNKPFLVLTRNGWENIEYVYKHKTDKTLHRIETKDGLIDVTEDHSLFDGDKNEVKPKDLIRGNKIELFNNNIKYKIDNSISLNKAWLFGFFMADGSSVYCDRQQRYFSKRKNEFVYHKGKRANWKISNQSLNRLEKAKQILENDFNVKCDIKDHMKSSNVYNLIVENADLAKYFSESFYTSYRYKKVPEIILNSSLEIKQSFIDGFCCGDGQGDTLDECVEFGQKSKVAMAGLYLMLKELGKNFRLHTRKDKPEFIAFRFKNHRGNILNENYSNRESDEVWNNNIITSKSNYVYDISANGTFVNAFGLIVCHNTDGFNFQIPRELRYTKETPYIGKGLNRNTEVGVEYYGVEGDVAEFNDLFMRRKMGLGIDEYAVATINFSRKNYADLLEKKGELKSKLVGNTIKSKKMPVYIEKFINEGVDLLLRGDGQKFLMNYYDYIDKIFNYKIPLRDIASKGKIKKTIAQYIEDCKTLTKAGRPKARQAWYELVIQDNLHVDVGDTIYYINTGKAKSHADYKKVTIKAKIDKETGEILEPERTEGQLNCKLLNPDVVEAEDDTFCDENTEYNVPKYIDQFNKRITPLLVCFSKDIRDRILITNPENRQYFTEEESVLVSGEPNKPTDQDTYEQLMTIEDKEIKYWDSVNEVPPFVEECGMNWEEIRKDYLVRMEELKKAELQAILEEYNSLIDALTPEDVEKFEETGEIPKDFLRIVHEDVHSDALIANNYDVKIGSIFDIRDKIFIDKSEEEDIKFLETNGE